MRPSAQALSADSWLGRNWGFCVAALIAIAVYLPAIGGEPIWDDAIVFDRYLPAFRGLGDAFFPPADTGELGQYYYRPFVTLSYLFDVAVFGQERFVGHHLTVMLFHAVAAVAVGVLAQRLLHDGPLARFAGFAAAACFAVHPVHVESVAQITGRCDPMAAAFLIGALLAVLRGRGRPRAFGPWLVAAALFFAALCSKEVAAVGVLLAALLLWLPTRVGAATWWRFGVAFGVPSLLYLALRAGAGLSPTPLLGLSFGESVERLVRAIGYHVGMVTLPVEQAAFVPLVQLPGLLGGAFALVLLVGAGIAAFAVRRTPFVLRVAWVWFVVTLAPALVLLLVKASEQPVAERYLYVPSVAVSLAFGQLVAWVGARRGAAKPTAIVVALALAVAAVATALRARVYTDNLTFWTDTAAKAPSSGLPQYQLGLTLRQAGSLDDALQVLGRALELYDDAEGRSLALNTIGTIHLERQDWQHAVACFERATAERPDYATPWFNLATVYGMRAETRRDARGAPDLADLERCVEALDRAVALRPEYDKARLLLARQTFTLAKVHLAHGRRDAAALLIGRAEAAAKWLLQRDPGGMLGQQGRAVLQELERLPR